MDWITYLDWRFGRCPERRRALRLLDIKRQSSAPPTPEELRNAREAQKWANHIFRRETARIHTERAGDDNARDAAALDEIPVLSDEQSARLRYVARTGKFPPPAFDWQDEP